MGVAPEYRELGYVKKAFAYCNDVVSGKVPACKWVRLACQRQLDDLANTSVLWPYRFDLAKAERACFFIEQLPHIKGFTGKIKLEPWQCFIVSTVFGWVKASTGRRRFRKVYIEVPRGNAKSTLSAGVKLYMGFLDGEQGAECYVAARTKEQTRPVFITAKKMVEKSPGLQEQFGVQVSSHSIDQNATTSWCRALASEAGSLDGLNIHCAIIDELHAHRTREVYDVLETGIAKRTQPLLWSITTAGSNRAGICYEVRTFVTEMLDKKIPFERQSGAESFFGIIYTIDDADDWTDPANWKKANPNWGISVNTEEFEALAFKAMQLASAQNNFKTKYLDLWVNADTAWMDMRAWDRCADRSLDVEDFTEEECIVGFDLASKLDIAAVIKLFRRMEEDETWHYYAFGDYWLPEETIEQSDNSQYAGWNADGGPLHACSGANNDYDVIEEHLREWASKVNVRETAFDPHHAHQIRIHLENEGQTMVEVRPLVLNFSPAMKELEALVLAGKFHHNGDPVLTWCIQNVVAHTDAKGEIYPRKARFENKIDAAVATFMALYRWTAFEDEGEASITFA